MQSAIQMHINISTQLIDQSVILSHLHSSKQVRLEARTPLNIVHQSKLTAVGESYFKSASFLYGSQSKL
jgi:hypothetical protein